MRVFALCVGGVAGLSLLRNTVRKGDPEPWACYHDSADSYSGTVAKSNTGQACMLWSDAMKSEELGPNFGALTFAKDSGDKMFEGNFCRAFDATEVVPWCFVKGAQTPGEARQECDVPACPTDGPWGRKFEVEAKDEAILCTNDDGAAVTDCDCSCAGVGGKAQKAFVQVNGKQEARYCHC